MWGLARCSAPSEWTNFLKSRQSSAICIKYIIVISGCAALQSYCNGLSVSVPYLAASPFAGQNACCEGCSSAIKYIIKVSTYISDHRGRYLSQFCQKSHLRLRSPALRGHSMQQTTPYDRLRSKYYNRQQYICCAAEIFVYNGCGAKK